MFEVVTQSVSPSRADSENGENTFRSKMIRYIDLMQGYKTAVKNLHWAAKRLSNSDKRGIHLYLDDFTDTLAEFEDSVFEDFMGINGSINPQDIQSISCACTDVRDLINSILAETLSLYENIPPIPLFSGMKSETEVFIHNLNQFKYRFSLTE